MNGYYVLSPVLGSVRHAVISKAKVKHTSRHCITEMPLPQLSSEMMKPVLLGRSALQMGAHTALNLWGRCAGKAKVRA